MSSFLWLSLAMGLCAVRAEGPAAAVPDASAEAEGDRLLGENELEGAEKLYLQAWKAATVDSKRALLYTKVGIARLGTMQGKKVWPAARDVFERAAKLDPKLAMAQWGLAETFECTNIGSDSDQLTLKQNWQNCEDAIGGLDAAIALDPKPAVFHYARAFKHWTLGISKGASGKGGGGGEAAARKAGAPSCRTAVRTAPPWDPYYANCVNIFEGDEYKSDRDEIEAKRKDDAKPPMKQAAIWLRYLIESAARPVVEAPKEIKGSGVKVGTGQAAAPSTRKLNVRVHADAKEWEPVSLVKSGDAFQAKTFFTRRIRKVKGAYKGEDAAAKAAARLHRVKDDTMLIIAVYPASLRFRRTHLEARFLIQEGFLEEVKVAAVSVPGGVWTEGDQQEDSFTLRAKGVEFEEEAPGSAQARLSAIDALPGKDALNAGSIRLAAFGDKDLAFVSFGWSVAGLKAAR